VVAVARLESHDIGISVTIHVREVADVLASRAGLGPTRGPNRRFASVGSTVRCRIGVVCHVPVAVSRLPSDELDDTVSGDISSPDLVATGEGRCRPALEHSVVSILEAVPRVVRHVPVAIAGFVDDGIRKSVAVYISQLALVLSPTGRRAVARPPSAVIGEAPEAVAQLHVPGAIDVLVHHEIRDAIPVYVRVERIVVVVVGLFCPADRFCRLRTPHGSAAGGDPVPVSLTGLIDHEDRDVLLGGNGADDSVGLRFRRPHDGVVIRDPLIGVADRGVVEPLHAVVAAVLAELEDAGFPFRQGDPAISIIVTVRVVATQRIVRTLLRGIHLVAERSPVVELAIVGLVVHPNAITQDRSLVHSGVIQVVEVEDDSVAAIHLTLKVLNVHGSPDMGHGTAAVVVGPADDLLATVAPVSLGKGSRNLANPATVVPTRSRVGVAVEVDLIGVGVPRDVSTLEVLTPAVVVLHVVGARDGQPKFGGRTVAAAEPILAAVVRDGPCSVGVQTPDLPHSAVDGHSICRVLVHDDGTVRVSSTVVLHPGVIRHAVIFPISPRRVPDVEIPIASVRQLLQLVTDHRALLVAGEGVEVMQVRTVHGREGVFEIAVASGVGGGSVAVLGVSGDEGIWRVPVVFHAATGGVASVAPSAVT